MRLNFWSKTTVGKWAGILTLLFIGLISVKLMGLRLLLPTPFIAGLGLIGFVMGLISIIKDKDRSIMTVLSIPVGLLIIFWTVAEIIFPH